MNDNIVEMKDIVMKIEDVKVINNARISVRKGEVCTLLGENYSGKSSLMKILSGVYRYDNGTILFDGKEVIFHTIADAQKLGIRMVYDGNNLMNDFTVIENIFLGDSQNIFGKIFADNKKQKKSAQNMLDYFNMNISLYSKVNDLESLHKKMIEIIRAVVFEPKVLILDEIMDNCSTNEQEILFGMIEKIKRMDIAVIYITKKIREAIRVSDKILVMNHGCTVYEIDIMNPTSINIEDIVKKMIGESYEERYQKTKIITGRTVLEVKGNSGININVDKGEVIGITGLNGAEKSELIYKMTGINKCPDWDIYLDGNSIESNNNPEIIKKKIVYLDCDFNQIMISNEMCKKGFLKTPDFSFVGEYFGDWMSFKNTYSSKLKLNPYEGILKKDSLLKWVDSEAELLIFNNPSENLNSEAKIEFYEILNRFLQSGKCVLIVTDDIAELNGFCNRIYKYDNGSIPEKLIEDKINFENIITTRGM